MCNRIKKLRKQLEEEDHLVRNAEEDFMNPANAFETNAGHFWGILGTRDYMRCRFEVADTVPMLNTLDGVRECLEHLRDLIRLSRGDNMGNRDIVPALMLRLDLDQECYDFIKWYATTGSRSDYDWGNMDLPFLNFKDADVLEDVDMFVKRFGVSHT